MLAGLICHLLIYQFCCITYVIFPEMHIVQHSFSRHKELLNLINNLITCFSNLFFIYFSHEIHIPVFPAFCITHHFPEKLWFPYNILKKGISYLILSSHRLHFHRPDSFAMMVHIEFFAYQIYLLYAIHQILAVQLSINQFLQSHSNEKSDNLHHMQQLSYPQLFFQENTSTAYQYVKPHAANISSQTAFDSHIGYILFQEMEIHYYFQ